MPRIISVGTASPPYVVTQEQAREFAIRLFRESGLDLERLLPVFANTTIRTRHFSMPLEWLAENRSFAEKNRKYLEEGLKLTEAAVLQACDEARISPRDIGHIFFVSTTGISTPSMDAHLFNRIKFRPNIRRTPIWGLGCAGGVAGISRAFDWLRAYPREIALVVSLELCSLTFLPDDLSKSNFVAVSLFGDGCGALLMSGSRSPVLADRILSVEAATAITWPDTLDVMGWDIAEEGLKVVFSRDIPDIVSKSAWPVFNGFLEGLGFQMSDIGHFVSHPGGVKVIDAYKEALGLRDEQVTSMREVLGNFGNMSSATVFFVMRGFMNGAQYRGGDLVLSTALGPGFSSETLFSMCV